MRRRGGEGHARDADAIAPFSEGGAAYCAGAYRGGTNGCLGLGATGCFGLGAKGCFGLGAKGCFGLSRA
jgi:hypothetical protein